MADTNDDFLNDLANVKASKQYVYMEKACKGTAVVKRTSFGETKDKEKAAFLELLVLKADPVDDRKPHVAGEELSEATVFERGKREVREIKMVAFKRNLCAIVGLDPKTCTKAQWDQAAAAFKNDQLVGCVFGFVPKDGKGKKDDGTPMVFFNFTSRPNTKESIARNKELLAKGADYKEFL